MDKQLGLLHVPKTGGTSMHQSSACKYFGHRVVIDEPNVNNPIYAHKEDQVWHFNNSVIPRSDLDSIKMLVIVRNPYSWLLSWFDFMDGFGPFDPKRDTPETRLAQTGFESFVDKIITRDDYWPNKKFIFFQMFALPSGNLIVDHILHTENLNKEFDNITGYRGEHRNYQLGKRHGRDLTTGKWYDKHPGLAERVFDTYHREFLLYGYSRDPHHEEHCEKDAILTGNVVDKKGHVDYNLADDILNVDQLEFPGK